MRFALELVTCSALALHYPLGEMKTKLHTTLAGIISAFGLLSVAEAVVINVNTIGTNITNTRGNANLITGTLVPFVYQGEAFAPANSSSATRLDWLNTGGTYNPGQIQGYNLITAGSLAQAGTNFVDDDNASENGTYTFTPGFTYYLTAHYGGSYVAWKFVATDPTATYSAPANIGGVTGANAYAALNPPATGNYNPNQGLSNVRAWQGARVPDGGTTLVSLGIALLGLGSIRRFLVSKI